MSLKTIEIAEDTYEYLLHIQKALSTEVPEITIPLTLDFIIADFIRNIKAHFEAKQNNNNMEPNE